MSTSSTQIASLVTSMKHALEQAVDLKDITRLRDEAEAVRCLVQKAKLGLRMHNEAAEFKLRVERKAGAMLARLCLSGGDRKSNGHDVRVKLRDLGVSYQQSSRWQREAAVPDTDFEQYLQDAREGDREVTSAELLRRARAIGPKARGARRSVVTAQRVGNAYVVVDPRAGGFGSRAVAPAVGSVHDLVAEARNHGTLLATILLPFCEHAQPVENASRRYAARLLHELNCALKQLEVRVQ